LKKNNTNNKTKANQPFWFTEINAIYLKLQQALAQPTKTGTSRLSAANPGPMSQATSILYR